MEASLAKSKNNLAEAQSIAQLGSWEFDLGKDEEYRSDEFFRILGLPTRGNGRAHDSVFTYIHPSDRERVRKCLTDTLEQGKPYDVEYRIIRPDATERIVHARGKTLQDASGKITRFIGTILDVTERKKLEQKYLQAQKMEAVGQLAGGIAHDFNNILTAIFGYQHLLLERLEDGKSRHFAGQVTTLAEKAANLTGNLLAFSRKQPVNPKPVDLNETVLNVGSILKRLIGEDIEFCCTTHDGLLPVMAVASQVEQVLMNLVTNARDAMPNGGILTISMGLSEIDANHVWVHGNGVPGKYAMISVSDTGAGMDEETQKRIFEPFFTTKDAGKGTGLGLSTAYGIVRQHGGFITVYSEPGEGTTFRIYLPLINAELTKQNQHVDAVSEKGSETVLLAEDDKNIREVIRSLLEGNGYTVITAVDGDEALEQYIAHEPDIDILILDVIMPKMNGKEVYDIVSRTGKKVKTMFISGYSDEIIARKGIPDICPLVTKPFSPHAFHAKLREILDH
jgi:PAS domain S-box-containing protein